MLVWKANRSKNQTRDRLASLGGSFRKAARSIARNLYEAKTPKERLRVLMQNWGFRLATGTALLTVLYPTFFTVYDTRVCTILGRFGDLADRTFSDDLWTQYLKFKRCVNDAVPGAMPLRDKDRYLWGRSLYYDCKRQCTGNTREVRGQIDQT